MQPAGVARYDGAGRARRGKKMFSSFPSRPLSLSLSFSPLSFLLSFFQPSLSAYPCPSLSPCRFSFLSPSLPSTRTMLGDAWLWVIVVVAILALLFLMVYNVRAAAAVAHQWRDRDDGAQREKEREREVKRERGEERS